MNRQQRREQARRQRAFEAQVKQLDALTVAETGLDIHGHQILAVVANEYAPIIYERLTAFMPGKQFELGYYLGDLTSTISGSHEPHLHLSETEILEASNFILEAAQSLGYRATRLPYFEANYRSGK